MKEFERLATNTGDWCRCREVTEKDFMVEVSPVTDESSYRHARYTVTVLITMSRGLEDELTAMCRGMQELKSMLSRTPLSQVSYGTERDCLNNSSTTTLPGWERISGHCKKPSTIEAKHALAMARLNAILNAGGVQGIVTKFIANMNSGFTGYCDEINCETLRGLKQGLNSDTWSRYADSLETTATTLGTVKALYAKVQALETKLDAAYLTLQKQREEAFVVLENREGWKVKPEGATVPVDLPSEYVEAIMGVIASGDAFKHRLNHSHVSNGLMQ